MTATPDITIVGGGIIGLLTARAFSLQGAQVTVIEKNQIGKESSWAGGGILLPLYPWRQSEAITTLVKRSLAIYPELSLTLAKATGIDPEFSPCGLFIAQNPDLPEALAWCYRHDFEYSCSTPALAESLNLQIDQPLWLPNIAHARNPRLLKSLKQDLLNRNVSLFEEQNLQQINLTGNKVTSIVVNDQHIAVNQLILAAGAWTETIFTQFLPAIVRPDIKPVKGQMLLYDANTDTLPFMVMEGKHYLIPRIDGKILVGSTVEDAQFDKSTSAEAFLLLKTFAESVCPKLKNHPIASHWAGLRPGTEKGIPYVSKHPEIENLSINAGHFRNGLVMAPASAELLVDLILHRTPGIEAAPYNFDSAH